MSKNNKLHVIVVRRNKKHRANHHSGSWKIAYADFMTAMMAFFLVMWLLSSTSPQQRRQIADYFKTPLKVALANGNKSSLSDSVIPGGGPDAIKNEGEIWQGNLRPKEVKGDIRRLQKARDKLEQLIRNDPRLTNFQSNLRISMTEEGLLIQIIDTQDRPMFKVGSKVLESYTLVILQALVPVLNELPNRISLTGHTDSLPYINGDTVYGNWELSADRANSLRRALMMAGMAGDKFIRVIGTADTMSFDKTSAENPINRRISILVLNRSAEQAIMQADTLLQPLAEKSGNEAIQKELSITPARPD